MLRRPESDGADMLRGWLDCGADMLRDDPPLERMLPPPNDGLSDERREPKELPLGDGLLLCRRDWLELPDPERNGDDSLRGLDTVGAGAVRRVCG